MTAYFKLIFRWYGCAEQDMTSTVWPVGEPKKPPRAVQTQQVLRTHAGRLSGSKVWIASGWSHQSTTCGLNGWPRDRADFVTQ